MTDVLKRLPNSCIPAFVVFIPLGVPLIWLFDAIMPLSWLSLAVMLRSISMLSIYVNITTNDIVWIMFGIWAYLTVSIPFYMNVGKAPRVGGSQAKCNNLTFPNLFKTCANAVFSDYKISLLSKIPLALQVLAGGSLLYEVFGADWILHTLAGFGIGALALKAYVTGVSHYGYNRLASYFHLDRFRTFKVERKKASREFTLFSIIVVALVWEIFERTVHFLSPVNVFRIGAESLWNITGDVVFAIIGAMVAWYLIERRLHAN
jgi:hypothetical protein